MVPSGAGSYRVANIPTDGRFLTFESAQMRSAINADVSDNPRFQFLLDYWTGKKGTRPAPARADIDPIEIKPVLGWVFIAEALNGGEDFRYRLIGTLLCQVYGVDFTGMTVKETFSRVDSQVRDSVLASYRKVLRDTCTLRATGRAIWTAKEWVGYDSFHLPLTGGAGQGDMVLGLVSIDM